MGEEQEKETTPKPTSDLVINLIETLDDPPSQTPSAVNECMEEALIKLDRAQETA